MFNDLLAALTLFTRLPVGRLRRKPIPPESFARAVVWWPVAGWLTGAVAAAVLWGAAQFVPPMATAVMAFGVRTLFTGAFHEDGLGDFFDGMGGGRTPARTLEIMKDSRAGSYGVVGTALYFALIITLVGALPIERAVVVVLVGDPLCKAIAGMLTNILPYARTVEGGKIGVAYRRMGAGAAILSLVAGVAPLAMLTSPRLWPAVVVPVAVMLLLTWMMRRRIGGYTGDCCGATFLLCEASFYVGVWAVLDISAGVRIRTFLEGAWGALAL
jgi:adenosylcobinamide-GDP ribazoletransferase